MGADPGLGDHGRRGGGGFASGGVLDAAPPGPGLARFADDAWRDGLGGLDDDELTGVMRAWRRLASRAAAGELAVVSELAARRAAGGRHASDHLDDEVGLALTLTRRAAGSLLDLALDLDRL